jgi:hypothetical protein
MKNIREYENLHIALWLLKDTCWVTAGTYENSPFWYNAWRTAGMVMIIPTLAVAIHICWKSRHHIADLFHNIAVCLWIAANAVWMTGEFFYADGTRPIAKIFFAAGIIVVGIYYTIHFPKRNKQDVQETPSESPEVDAKIVT